MNQCCFKCLTDKYGPETIKAFYFLGGTPFWDAFLVHFFLFSKSILQKCHPKKCNKKGDAKKEKKCTLIGKMPLWSLVKVGNSAFFWYDVCGHWTGLKICLTKMALIAIKMSSRVTNTIRDWKRYKYYLFSV